MQRIRLPRAVLVEDAERAAFQVARAAIERTRLELDLEAVRTFRPGAAARLTNPLRFAAEAGCQVDLIVPSRAGGLQPILASGIGLQVARHASSIRSDGRLRTRELREVLSTDPELPVTALLASDLHRHPMFMARNVDSVVDVLRTWLDRFPKGRGRIPNKEELRCIAILVGEAVANVQDHSRKQPLPDGSQVHSYVHFRWRSRTELTTLLAEGVPMADPSTTFLSALLASRSPAGLLGGILEIDVVDDGVGVASRHSLNAGLVLAPTVAAEREALSRALTAGESVKLKAQDCPVDKKPGYGSALVADQIILMGGYVSVRTGRLIASLGGPSEPETSFALGNSTLGLMPGCIVSVLLPVFARPRPLQRLDLDPQERLF